MDYLDTSAVIGQNYTGPYISNGKFQKSVSFGDRAPLTVLDSYSRLHDTVYALYEPGIKRKAADSIYHDRASQLPGALPSLAGDAVLYGNAGLHSLGNLATSVGTGFKYGGPIGAFGGLVYGGVENMIDLYDYMTHADEAKKDVLKLESLDPYPQFQLSPHIDVTSSTKRNLIPTEYYASDGINAESINVDGQPNGPTNAVVGSVVDKSGSATCACEPDCGTGTLSSVSPPTQWLGGGEYKTMVKNQKQKQNKLAITVKMPKAPKQKPNKPKNKAKKMAVTERSSGAISSITTAPVAIGNSVRGSESIVVGTGKNGIIVRGRDFMFAPVGTGSVTTWTLCGGSPLSPAAFADTTLANYMRIYAKFRFRAITAHFITSSPTSANGDVMFYYGKDRSSVFLNQTSTQLLGFVLSDPNTVIGPQWTNHSAQLKVSGDWKLTDYGMHDGIEEYADGELFLLSKTSTTDSPGYVLFDYVIEFAEHQLQPRLLEFPIPRIQWSQVNLAITSVAVTQADSVSSTQGLQVSGNNISGTASAVPSGTQIGDIFKMVLDITNSASGSWTVATPASAWAIRTSTAGSGPAFTLSDGVTLYAQYSEGNRWSIFANPTAAFAGEIDHMGIVWRNTGTTTMNVQCWLSYIGSAGSKAFAPNY
jgi:hypothetical protein